jgi:hypothetical protein
MSIRTVKRKIKKEIKDASKVRLHTLISKWKVDAILTDDSQFLGIYEGHVFDIAKRLSGVPCYYLNFKQVDKDTPLDRALIPPAQKNYCHFHIVGEGANVARSYERIMQLAIQQPPKYPYWNLVLKGYLRLEFLK